MQKPEKKYWKSNELILCRIDIREGENMNEFPREDLYLFLHDKSTPYCCYCYHSHQVVMSAGPGLNTTVGQSDQWPYREIIAIAGGQLEQHHQPS